jgi:hypothetical protein
MICFDVIFCITCTSLYPAKINVLGCTLQSTGINHNGKRTADKHNYKQ